MHWVLVVDMSATQQEKERSMFYSWLYLSTQIGSVGLYSNTHTHTHTHTLSLSLRDMQSI
jgi:hypothetical protein